MSYLSLEKIREDTAGCSNKIFLNSAGSSLMPKVVVESMITYLRQEEEIGGYDLAKKEKGPIENLYKEVAKLLNSQVKNIAFTYNATDAYSRALSSIPFKSGDYILTTDDDYASNQISFLGLQKRFGILIARGKNLPNGDLDLNDFESQIKQIKPALIAVTHIPTNSGMIQPVVEIGELCKKFGIWYLLDACQSIGQIGVDVQKIGCDFLSATGRKFLRGPRGTGLLFLSDRVIHEGLEPLMMDLHGAEWIGFDHYKAEMNAKRFEFWEFSYTSLIGLSAAIHYANNIGIENIENYNFKLMHLLRSELSKNSSLRILDKGSRQSSLLTFDIPGKSIEKLEYELKSNKVYYSISTKNAALIDFTKKGIEYAIRLSPHYFNSLEEMQKVSEILEDISKT